MGIETLARFANKIEKEMKNPTGCVQICGTMENMEIGNGWIGVTYHGFNLGLLGKRQKDLEDAKAFIETIIIVLKRCFENLVPLVLSLGRSTFLKESKIYSEFLLPSD